MASYFITGATGTIGKEVVTSLLENNATVIAATRNPEKSQDLFNNKATSVHFDYGNKDTFNQVQGTDGILIIGPPLNPALFELLEPFVGYIQDNYTGRVVYLSGYGMDALKQMPFHALMENKLKSTNLNWNIVRPGFFMQNFGNYERENIEQRNVLFSPAGEGKTPFVSATDIASAISVLLTDQNRKHQTHILTGAKAYSHFDVAELLTTILGTPIAYANPDQHTYRKVLKDSGAPDFIADYMIPIYGLVKNGTIQNTTNSIKELTGRDPETLEEVLKRDFS
ncbi:NAD(P)H-binding protein [Aquimarina longa]|uniref:NmrA family NAD(P)-binding protein n=1 Tax=Aquimarina longa TaxID=1080221 RepID=UPI000781F2E0|nr:NAD(P)H-binding protein [Aquimarina longa]